MEGEQGNTTVTKPRVTRTVPRGTTTGILRVGGLPRGNTTGITGGTTWGGITWKYHGEYWGLPRGVLKGEKYGYNGVTTGKYRGHHWGFGWGRGHKEIPRLLNHGLLVYYIIK